LLPAILRELPSTLLKEPLPEMLWPPEDGTKVIELPSDHAFDTPMATLPVVKLLLVVKLLKDAGPGGIPPPPPKEFVLTGVATLKPCGAAPGVWGTQPPKELTELGKATPRWPGKGELMGDSCGCGTKKWPGEPGIGWNDPVASVMDPKQIQLGPR